MRSVSSARCCLRRTTRCGPSSRRRPGPSRSRTWFVARGHQRRCRRASTSRARPRHAPPPACSTRSTAADLILIAPSNPYVSIGPILAVARSAPRSRIGACPASPSARSSAGERSKARPTGCSRGSPAAPPRARRVGCYDGLIDVLVVDEADAPAELPGLRSRRHADADDRRATRGGASRARRSQRPARRVKVAILGGTGSFGRALAARLVALREDDVVIGSRDADRARRAAAELGANASRRRERGRRARRRPRRARGQGRRRPRHGPLDSRARSTRRRSSRSRAPSSFARRRRLPRSGCAFARGARSQDSSSRAGRRGPSLDRRREPRLPSRPTRTPSSAATTRARRSSRSSSPGSCRRTCARRGPARERAGARGPDGGDREPEPRYRAHAGIRVTGVPDRRDLRSSRSPGCPRSRRATTSRRSSPAPPTLVDGDVVVVAQKACRRPKAASSGSTPSSRRDRARELAGDRARPAASSRWSCTRRARVVRERGPLVIARDPARVRLRLRRG